MVGSASAKGEAARLRDLLTEQRFAEALVAADALLRRAPDDRDALYVRAHAQRQLGEVAAALETLTRLERAHPRFSRLFQERGYCNVALKNSSEAIAAFERALSLSPVLPASWSMLDGLYRMMGRTTEAAQAAAQLRRLQDLPQDIVRANALFADGDLQRAEEICKSYLLQHGHHVDAMRLLARIAAEGDFLDEAQTLLEAVIDLAPEFYAARYDYAQVLAKRHLYLKANKESETLLAIEPLHRGYRTLHATSLVGLGKYEQAIETYRQLLIGAHQPAEVHLSIAHVLKTLGRKEAAISEYQKAAAIRLDYGDAYWSLANLKTYRFADDEIDDMVAAESAPSTRVDDRYHLDFALGKAFEDRHQYARSFEYYRRGNDLKRREVGYQPAQSERNTRLQKETCTSALFASHRDSGAAARDPIFIVGLPRAGSTLIEQILASHAEVEGTHELADVPRFVAELNGRHSRYPAILSNVPGTEFRRLGEKYLSDSQVFRQRGRPRFIDKMPNNFRHIGLLHLMLPNAKIIDVRREPMACCFGNFKQLFAQGQVFTYGLEDIARYYRTYLDLMRHWDAVLPGRVFRVHYEDVVDDLPGLVRRLLDYCELEFDAACLEYHATERSVRSASSEQVRQPIYRDGLSQWRHYEPWLGDLRKSLGDAVSRYRD